MNNIISIVVILTSIGLFFGYVDPTYSEVRTLRIEKAEYDRALNNSNELQDEKNRLIAKNDGMDDVNVEALTKLLPDNIDNIRLIIDVDEMAKVHKMQIRNFKTETGDKKEVIGKDNAAYGTLTLSFSTSAPYGTFLSFLRDLEKSLRIIDVSSIDFTVAESNQIYDFDVKVKTYWLK